MIKYSHMYTYISISIISYSRCVLSVSNVYVGKVLMNGTYKLTTAYIKLYVIMTFCDVCFFIFLFTYRKGTYTPVELRRTFTTCLQCIQVCALYFCCLHIYYMHTARSLPGKVPFLQDRYVIFKSRTNKEKKFYRCGKVLTLSGWLVLINIVLQKKKE